MANGNACSGRKIVRIYGLSFVKSCDILAVVLRYPVFGGSSSGDGFLSPDLTKGGLLMYVTYSDLIQIGILVVSVCSLIVQICKKK